MRRAHEGLRRELLQIRGAHACQALLGEIENLSEAAAAQLVSVIRNLREEMLHEAKAEARKRIIQGRW